MRGCYLHSGDADCPSGVGTSTKSLSSRESRLRNTSHSRLLSWKHVWGESGVAMNRPGGGGVGAADAGSSVEGPGEDSAPSCGAICLSYWQGEVGHMTWTDLLSRQLFHFVAVVLRFLCVFFFNKTHKVEPKKIIMMEVILCR